MEAGRGADAVGLSLQGGAPGDLGVFASLDVGEPAIDERCVGQRPQVLGELKNTFKPEFLNRIDAIMVFHSLRQEHVRQIVDLMLNRVRAQLTEQQVELLVPEDAKDYLVTKGYDPQYGARPLRRTIQNLVEDPLAEGLLQGKFRPGDIIEGTVVEGAFVLEVHERRDDLLRKLPQEPALSAGEAGGGEAGR